MPGFFPVKVSLLLMEENGYGFYTGTWFTKQLPEPQKTPLQTDLSIWNLRILDKKQKMVDHTVLY